MRSFASSSHGSPTSIPNCALARKRWRSSRLSIEQELEEAKEANTVPNPFYEELTQRVLLLKLQEPRAIEAVAQMEEGLGGSPSRPATTCPNFDQVHRTRAFRDKQEELLRRLIARVDEIEVARNLSINNLQILEPADRKYAQEQDKLAQGRLLDLRCAGPRPRIAAVIGLLGAVRDRRLRTMEDCAEILGARRRHASSRSGEDAARSEAALAAGPLRSSDAQLSPHPHRPVR